MNAPSPTGRDAGGALDGTVKVVPYHAKLIIRNLDGLPRGLGARYLECITHNGELVAKQWRRSIPATFEVLVDFKPTAVQSHNRRAL